MENWTDDMTEEDWTERLDTAVTEHRWRDVDNILLCYGDVISVDSRHKAQEACIQNIQTANDSFSTEGIIQYCEREQLDIVLNIALTEGLWFTVIKVLEKGVPGLRQRKVIVDTFIENATENELYAGIIPHCDREQLDRVLNRAVTEGRWSTVIRVLEKGVPDKQQRKKVVDKFIENESEKKLFSSIIPHCDREQLNRVLNRAVTEGWWSTVIGVQETGVPSKQQRKKAIDKFIENATENELCSSVIPQCDREQLNRMLNRAVTEGWWSIVIGVLETGVPSKQQRKEAVDKFIENKYENELYALIIPHCDREQLNRVLNRAVTEGWWYMVIKVLEKGVSAESKHAAVDLFIDKACECSPKQSSISSYKCWHYLNIMQYCDREQQDRVLNRALTEKWWPTLISMLETDVHHKQQRKLVVDAFIENATEGSLADIITHCDREQLNRVLNRAVTENWVEIVVKVMVKYVSEKKEMKAVFGKSIANANNDDYRHTDILHFDRKLNRAVTEGWWDIVIFLLENDYLDEEQSIVAVDECIENAPMNNLEDIACITERCDRKQLDRLLKKAVREEEWNLVIDVLITSDLDEEQRKVAVDEVIEIMYCSQIIPYCDKEQLNRVLDRVISEDRWDFVTVELLEENYLDKEQMKLAVNKFLEKATWAYDYLACIIKYCDTEQLDRVLIRAITEELWYYVIKMLEKGVSAESKHKAVDIFIDRASEFSVGKASIDLSESRHYLDIIQHCDREQQDRALNRALTEGWWTTVIKGLEKIVHDKQQRKVAVDAFIENAPRRFYADIIPQCDREQLDTVLNRALTEGLWSIVIKVREKGILDKQQWKEVFDTFIENATFIFYEDIIPYCDREQLNRLLNRALTEASWATVMKVLEKNVLNKQQRKVVINKFIENATEGSLADIITHCDRDQLNRVLNRAVTEGWWNIGIKMLKTGVVDTEQRKVLVGTFIENAPRRSYAGIIPYCDREQLNRVLNGAISEASWATVMKVLEKGVLSKQQRIVVINILIENATSDVYADIILLCDGDQLNRVLNRAVTERWWDTGIKVLKTGVVDTAQRKVLVGTFIENATGEVYADIIPHCDREQLDRVLNRVVKEGWWSTVIKVLQRGVHDKEQMKVAVDKFIENAIMYDFTDIIPHCDREQLDRALDRAVTEGWLAIVESVIMKCAHITSFHTWTARTYHTMVDADLTHSSETMKLFRSQNTDTSTSFLNLFPSVNWVRLSEDHKTLSLMISLEELRIKDLLLPFSVNLSDLAQEEQSVCVMILMKQDRWDEISKVCLCHLWEQVGRELLQEAVDQRRWSIVQQWADHSVYDDQRWWAVKEAYKEKQWRVMLLLSDHGLTEIELMWVYYRLAMFADWATVGHMLQRGVDVTDLREVVENAMISTKTARDPAKRLALGKRWQRLKALEQKMSNVSSRQAYKAAKSCKWNVVMPSLHYQYGKIRHQLIQITLKAALEHRAWHVVMQLIKLDMEQAQRDLLFTDMVRQQQWGVCRALLDHGVSVHLCLDVLPQLMQEDQWLLVARMMEYDLDDAKRRDVIQRAMERRQGSVVWRCISTMQHYRLSEEEREQLFHQAISRCVLQAVKPLIEEKDQTGLRHRDGALLAGIELRQWDVVDYCEEQHADINMKNGQGEKPLNRAARIKDWKTVKALVVRGGDTNMLYNDGVSLLHRTIRAKQMDLTKLVIEYHGDIHQEIDDDMTPLQSLIYDFNGDVIHHTLMWCPDQGKVVDRDGKTTLHAIALDKRPEFLYHQVARGVNPLSVTKDGQSVLLCAVRNEHCAQRMVAECIRLGFSTHQPALTITRPLGKSLYDNRYETSSPLLLAVTKANFTLAHMLYESGSCSYSQLFHMFTEFLELSDPFTERRQSLRDQELDQYNKMVERFETFLPDLSKMATTARSLVSTCRLVISHCLNVRRRYVNDVYQLGLTDKMTNYILFSDLTDPDYERCLHGTLSPPKPQK